MENEKQVQVPCKIKKFSEEKTSGNLEKVKIVVMHEGENLNRSFIGREAIDDAEPTLKNIPILAYIKRDEDGEAIDFDQHNVITKIVQGENGSELKEFYLEKPIGVIPETNEYAIEEIDGVEHVTCIGYIWKTYSNEGYDLISESGEKGVSMEISVEEGNKDKKTGLYHINKYSYLGVTALSDSITPAMGDTCKLTTFSSNEESFKFALEELTKEVEKLKQEVQTMSVVDPNATQEPVVDEDTVPNVEHTECEQTDPVASQEPTEGEEGTESETTEGEEEVKENFSLSIDNLTLDIRNTLCSRKVKKKYSWDNEEYEVQEFYLRTILPEENIVVVEDNVSDGYRYYGIPYSMNGDSVVMDFDNKVEYIQTWRVKEVDKEVLVFCEKSTEEQEAVSEKFSQLESEIVTLKETIETKDEEISKLAAFKQEKEKESLVEEVEQVIAKFSDLTEEEVKEVKEQALNQEITIEKLKFNLYAFRGMKVEKENEKFSQKASKVADPIKVAVTSPIEPQESSRYGSLYSELERISKRGVNI